MLIIMDMATGERTLVSPIPSGIETLARGDARDPGASRREPEMAVLPRLAEWAGEAHPRPCAAA